MQAETRRALSSVFQSQQGITGLETAIILIAFVTVASVFAFTTLSAGIFSSQKGKEAVTDAIAQSGSAPTFRGSLLGIAVPGVVIDTADTVWDARTNVIAHVDTSDFKEGTGSALLTIASGFSTGQVAHQHLPATIDASDYYTVGLWLKPDKTVNSGQFRLTFYSNTSGDCTGTLQTLTVPALVANTWQQVRMKSTNRVPLTNINCIALDAVSDPGVLNLHIDLVEAPPEVQQLEISLGSAFDGAPIDLNTTTDSDSDGLLSDQSTKRHTLTVAYQDELQYVQDITWTVTTIGKNDGDALLEPNERIIFTIKLNGLLPLPTEGTRFSIHIKPIKGAALGIKRLVPPLVDAYVPLK